MKAAGMLGNGACLGMILLACVSCALHVLSYFEQLVPAWQVTTPIYLGVLVGGFFLYAHLAEHHRLIELLADSAEIPRTPVSRAFQAVVVCAVAFAFVSVVLESGRYSGPLAEPRLPNAIFDAPRNASTVRIVSSLSLASALVICWVGYVVAARIEWMRNELRSARGPVDPGGGSRGLDFSSR